MSADKRDNGSGIDVLDRNETATKPKLERPKMYKVLLHNDDFTPPQVVVHVLQEVFKIGGEKAFAIMLTAHQTGLCLVCVYSRDIAETKVEETKKHADKYQCPLMFTCEPEE